MNGVTPGHKCKFSLTVVTHEARENGNVETDGAAGLIMVFPARYDITQKQIPEGRTR